jgi:hypothetical protein
MPKLKYTGTMPRYMTIGVMAQSVMADDWMDKYLSLAETELRNIAASHDETGLLNIAVSNDEIVIEVKK